MRVDTANKFLKLMEEPTDRTVMLFVTQHSDRLLATIRSRVQRIQVPNLRPEEAAQGLVQRWGVDGREFGPCFGGQFGPGLAHGESWAGSA